VKDRVGLEGLYPTDPPEFVTAVREQLGLRFDAARGPVDVLVILNADQGADLATHRACLADVLGIFGSVS